jgi:prepilin peptidase CpaA
MNPELLLWPMVACAVVGAAIDIKERRLPNWLCLVTAVIAGCFVTLTDSVAGLTSALVHCGLALVVGIGLFRFGFVGGGDAKFYAACAIAFPLSKALPFLGWTSLTGLVLVLAMVLLRAARKVFLGHQIAALKFSVPYGVAIGGGAAITLLR